MCAIPAAYAAPSQCDLVAGNLVTNCGFETGNFAAWTQSGNLGFTFVSSGYAHSGTYGAQLGPVGSDGFISQQILPTIPGATYDLSYWLQSDGFTPNHFDVSWDGITIRNDSNLGAFPYTQTTNLGLVATTASTTLRFSFRDDPGFLGLDDISVVQHVPEPTTFALFAPLALGLGLFYRRRSQRV
jgi:hypothetical protein